MRGHTPLCSVLTCVGKRDCLGQLVCSAQPLLVPRSIGCPALFTALSLQSGHGQTLSARTYIQILRSLLLS